MRVVVTGDGECPRLNATIIPREFTSTRTGDAWIPSRVGEIFRITPTNSPSATPIVSPNSKRT